MGPKKAYLKSWLHQSLAYFARGGIAAPTKAKEEKTIKIERAIILTTKSMAITRRVTAKIKVKTIDEIKAGTVSLAPPLRIFAKFPLLAD